MNGVKGGLGLLALLCLMFLPQKAEAQMQRVGSGMLIITNTSASTPVAFTNANTFVRRVTVYGQLNARTANTGDVYIGPSSANDTQPHKVVSSGQTVIEAAPGTEFNLKDWYLDVTVVNDGVVLVFQ